MIQRLAAFESKWIAWTKTAFQMRSFVLKPINIRFVPNSAFCLFYFPGLGVIAQCCVGRVHFV